MARSKVNRHPTKARAQQHPPLAPEFAGFSSRRKSLGKSPSLAAETANPRREGNNQTALAAPAAAGAGPASPGLAASLLVAQKIKELVRLAHEQGHLTYSDITDALPDALAGPEELDEIYVKLRNLEVEIVDQSEVDRIKQLEPEEEDEKARLDILDDPVRMYLRQMGQAPC